MSTIEKTRTFEENGTATTAGTGPTRSSSSPRASAGSFFSAFMLGFVGIWGIIEGLLAVGSSKVFVANATFVFSDLNTWGS